MSMTEKIPLRKKLEALLKGSLLGTVVLHVSMILGTAVFGLLNDPNGLSNFKFDLPSFLIALAATEIGWLLGLLLVGLPAWCLFEKRGWCEKRHAQLLGFGVNSIVMAAVYKQLPNFMQSIKLAIVLGFALLGLFVATYIWKQAYKNLPRAD